jgi:predicted transcriptional regulator
MNLQAKQIAISQIPLTINNRALINSPNLPKTNLWDELSSFQKAVVKQAKEEIAKGEGLPHSAVMKKYKKWLTK